MVCCAEEPYPVLFITPSSLSKKVPLAQTLWLCPIQEYFWNHGFKKIFCPMVILHVHVLVAY